MSEHGKTLGGVHAHGLDHVAIPQDGGQVSQFAVDARDDDAAAIADHVSRCGALGHRTRLLTFGRDDGDRQVCHRSHAPFAKPRRIAFDAVGAEYRGRP